LKIRYIKKYLYIWKISKFEFWSLFLYATN